MSLYNPSSRSLYAPKVFEHAQGDGLPRQWGKLPPQVARGMLASPQNRSSKILPEMPAGSRTMYMVAVRDMSSPEKTVFLQKPISDFKNWYKNFENDVFKNISTTFSYPSLRQSAGFYSVTFYGEKGNLFNVGVWPVFDDKCVPGNDDTVRIVVVSPFDEKDDGRAPAEFYEKKLRQPHFISDMANMYIARASFFGHGGDERGFFLQQSMPKYWDFVFRSETGKESRAGDKIIPQILGRLYFLRDSVTQAVDYSIVQLNRFAYVGMISNLAGVSLSLVMSSVAGFNVYFQVNCAIPLDNIQWFFPDNDFQTKPSMRTAPSELIFTQPDGGTRTQYASELALVTLSRNDVEAEERKTPPRYPVTADIFNRVKMHLSQRASAIIKLQTASETKRFMGSVTLFIEKYIPLLTTRDKNVSAVEQQRVVEAFEDVRFTLLSNAIGCVSDEDELRKLQDDEELYTVENLHKVTAVLKDADWKHIPSVAKQLVPSVFATYTELAVFLAGMRQCVTSDVEKELFGDDCTRTFEATALRWSLKHTAPASVTNALRDTTISVTVADFGEWFASEYAGNGGFKFDKGSVGRPIRKWDSLVANKQIAFH